MSHYRPFEVTGFHSCDKAIGLDLLQGRTQLKPSKNKYDWLGEGVYFWEQNPGRSLEYAEDCANGKQFYSGNIKTPFVVGAIIELGNCLNLIEPDSLKVLKEAYKNLKKIMLKAGQKMPVNIGPNRRLDAAVFKHLHNSTHGHPTLKYDTIRCAFFEGLPIYGKANFRTGLHIEISVLNIDLIRGYYLPLPAEKYNPYLNREFVKTEPKKKKLKNSSN